jgi:hypothetical protein
MSFKQKNLWCVSMHLVLIILVEVIARAKRTIRGPA